MDTKTRLQEIAAELQDVFENEDEILVRLELMRAVVNLFCAVEAMESNNESK